MKTKPPSVSWNCSLLYFACVSIVSLCLWSLSPSSTATSHYFTSKSKFQLPFEPPSSKPSVKMSIPRPNGKVNIGYFTNWGIYARNYKPQNIPIGDLTHLLYAFADIKTDSGEVFLTDLWADEQIHYEGDSWNDEGTNLYGNLKALHLLKRQNRSLKLMLSIGGWSFSKHFEQPASTDQGRERIVESAIKLLEDYGFDGIDLDWEYPSNASQAQDYVDLLAAFRAGLDQHAASKGLSSSQGHELSVAAPCGVDHYQTLKLREMDQYLSFWNLMAYDYSGSWESKAGHQAALYDRGTGIPSTEKAVNYYLAQGIAAAKLVIGIPLYGRSFMTGQGVGSPFSGVGKGSWEAGVYDYKSLPLPSSAISHDSNLVASSCQTSEEFVSYDNPDAVRQKVQWINEKGLAGAMYWELSGDKPSGDGESLVKIAADLLGRDNLDKRENCLSFAGSRFDNLRKGM